MVDMRWAYIVWVSELLQLWMGGVELRFFFKLDDLEFELPFKIPI